MKTRHEQMTAGGIDSYRNFLGDDSEYADWYGVAGRSRDSRILEESNFTKTLELLGGESDTVRVERYGHWACGWIEEIYVKPGSDAERIARDIEKRLANYPVLDEDDLSARQFDEAGRYWDCLTMRERIELLAKNEESIFASRAEYGELYERAPNTCEDVDESIEY